MFDSYDPSSPDLLDEIKKAKGSIVNIGELHRLYTLAGMEMADPEWTLQPVLPLLDQYIETGEFGDTYNYLPDIMSKKLYGTHELWPLLMHINGVANRADFVGPKIKYFRPTAGTVILSALKFARDRMEKANAKEIPEVADLTIRRVYG